MCEHRHKDEVPVAERDQLPQSNSINSISIYLFNVFSVPVLVRLRDLRHRDDDLIFRLV